MLRADPPASIQRISVYKSIHVRVTNGANFGDPISFADDLILDDMYRISPVAALTDLSLSTDHLPPYRIGKSTQVGTPGADVYLDCRLTFMSGNGTTTEALVLVEVDGDGNATDTFLMPLGPMEPEVDYALVGIDVDSALQVFAQAACVSFTGGTRITMSTGAQKPVEELEIGDRVLTRDNGPQEIRWIGHQTLRATGAFAPILIQSGTLNNLNDLLVSPDHRLFIYQRTDQLGAGRNEVLVRARHLVNGTSVRVREGGYIDYYQMLFDHHQIIFAEGIAAESMMVDQRTSAALPDDIGLSLEDLVPRHRTSGHDDLEVRESLLARPDAADLLRKSSGS